MTKAKKARLRAIQDERLKEFIDQKTDHYEERKVGDQWHIKNWNGGTTNRWQVSIYTEESFKRYQGYKPNNNTQ